MMISLMGLSFYGGFLLAALGLMSFLVRPFSRWRRWGWPLFWLGLLLVVTVIILWGFYSYRLAGERRFLSLALYGGVYVLLLLVGMSCAPSLAVRSFPDGDDPFDAEERI